MRLLIATGIFPPETGGPATYSEFLASEFARRGHDVKLITYSDEASKPEDDRYPFKVVRITRSRFKAWHYFKYMIAVKNLGREAELLYAQDPVSSGYPTMLAARKLGKPFVLKITGDYSWEQAMNRGLTDKLIDDFQLEKSLPEKIEKIRGVQVRVAKTADRIIVPSEYLKNLVSGWGVDDSKINVVYNSIPSMPGLNKAETRAEFSLSPDDFLVVSAGREVPWKGFDTLEQIVGEIKVARPEISLEILKNRPKGETLKYLKAADAFVLNSGYEGFSHMLLEAMILGTPIITTRVGGNSELINDGENGLLVEYGDNEELKQAIVRLYEDRGLAKRLAEQGQRDFEEMKDKLSPESMISKTLEILKKCAF